MNLSALLSKIGISQQLTQDVSLIIIIFLASFLFGMLIGRHRIMAALISTYVSFALISAVPGTFWLGYSYQFFAFLGIAAVLTLANKRFLDVYFPGSSFLGKVYFISFLEIVLILSIGLSFLPTEEALNYVSATAYSCLVSGWSQIFWMIAPLIFMFFFGRRRYN
ncbi:MAG: hypothetical protein CO140_02830 [Candidatus Moranbacteria bacterium CG_4_9_14_3_um_filter_40_7]|nr:MAG: hypothetical protein CO140_02830 [Candidatus Moranbacteria bacterium CG_4_9_14_3_um_filter_40_7]